MSFQLLDEDPWTGVRTLFDYDEMTDRTIIRREQPVGGILDFNKALQAENLAVKPKPGDPDFRLQARIPLIVYEKWHRDHGVAVWKANEDPDHMRAVVDLVNSPDWRYLKAIPGTV